LLQAILLSYVNMLCTMRIKAATILTAVIVFMMPACTKNADKPATSVLDENAEVAVQWADMALYTLRFSAFNTPTYSSRSLGYLGLTMYECIVYGDPSHRSMSGQLNGLSLLPPDMNQSYHWLIALNAGQETLLKLLYPAPGNSHRFVHERIDSLSRAILANLSKGVAKSVVDRSVAFGRETAQAIFDWSATDGGHEGFKRNFDPSVSFPKGPSYWVPPLRGQTISPYPLHPKWGNNRSFVPSNSGMAIPVVAPYSTDTASAYYKLYKAVYDKDKTLTQEEMETAAWWGDDPTETFSPPGHSYHITSIAVKKSNANIITAAEAYAKTGMAVADAFIQCWKAKVTWFNERPSTFVRANINPAWVQFWPEPPFPAFPSGHSIQSAAAGIVQTNVFGNNFSFTDSVHTGYRRFDDPRFLSLRYPPRHFSSFMEAANECAYSRFLGGIHTMQDNDAGSQQGQQIGQNVNALQWKN
jgi:hypothetical protein